MGRFKKVRKGWYEREEVNRITHDWVKMNCKNITNREKELLKVVYERKLVRRDHLEVILDKYREIPNRTIVLNRSINKLFNKMCLDKVHEEQEYLKGNKPAIVSLDRAGAMLLDVPFRRRIKQSKRVIQNKTMAFREIPSNYLHIHGVNQLEVETIYYCLSKGYEIIRWDLEEENRKVFSYNEKLTIIPDVFLLVKANNKPFLTFIEYDTGTENNRFKDKFPTIRDKLEKYRAYMLSGSWKNEWWSKKIKTNFPLILFVTEDKNRIDYVNKKGKELGLHVLALPANDYTVQLEEIIK